MQAVHHQHGQSLLDFAIHHCRDLGLITRRFPGGTRLFVPHDETTSVFVVRSGKLRVSAPTEGGKDVFLAELGEGDIVGEVSAISGARQATIVEAVEDTEAYVFTRTSFLRVLQECPAGALQVMRTLCDRLKTLNQRHIENVSLPMAARLAAELGRLARETDGGLLVERAPTHAELAEMIGSHREAVTKELRALSRAGVLRVRRGLIEILKPEDLIERTRPH